jgi:signal transduction histidine kinase
MKIICNKNDLLKGVNTVMKAVPSKTTMPILECILIDASKNEIKFTEPEKAPVVYADSIKTYRIISNLFSNAKKYSAKGTRVYASVYEDNSFGYFEIKNTSREPLNISPEALTERFVRGDESRTNEGNGLGLSIAKDLCKLQGGELNISIDGDLFKATVKLPKN